MDTDLLIIKKETKKITDETKGLALCLYTVSTLSLRKDGAKTVAEVRRLRITSVVYSRLKQSISYTTMPNG